MITLTAGISSVAVAATAPWQALAVRRETGSRSDTRAAVIYYAVVAGLVTFGLAFQLPVDSVLPATPLLIAGLPLAIIDTRCHRLPGWLTGGALLAVALMAAVVTVVQHAPDRLIAATVGALAMSGFYLVVLVLSVLLGSTAAYGLGDVSLAFPLGLALGWLGLRPWLTALLGAHVLYLAIHGTRAAAGRTGWRTRHAFGPPMLAAALIAAATLGPGG